MAKRGWTLVCLFVAACGGKTGGAPDGSVTIDAAGSIDAKPPCNVLYLNFESQALTSGTEDATNNVSSIINQPEVAPGYRQSDPNRAMKMLDITGQVKGALQPFGVTVVTTRPASGDYTMVIIGGASQDIGLQAGFGGTAPFKGCDMPIPKRITFAFDNINGNSISPVAVANIAIGSYLVSLGAPTSSDAMDCLCWDAPTCTNKVACTIGGAQTPRYQSSQCGSGATFDEPAKLTQLLTCP